MVDDKEIRVPSVLLVSLGLQKLEQPNLTIEDDIPFEIVVELDLFLYIYINYYWYFNPKIFFKTFNITKHWELYALGQVILPIISA